MTPLQVIAERESVYQLLSQTTPENLRPNHSQFTLDPATRSAKSYTWFYHDLAYKNDVCFWQPNPYLANGGNPADLGGDFRVCSLISSIRDII